MTHLRLFQEGIACAALEMSLMLIINEKVVFSLGAGARLSLYKAATY